LTEDRGFTNFLNPGNSHLYPKNGSFSATFNEFASESASKIARFKMALTKVGVLLMHPKMTHMSYARSSVSNGFALVEADIPTSHISQLPFGCIAKFFILKYSKCKSVLMMMRTLVSLGKAGYLHFSLKMFFRRRMGGLKVYGVQLWWEVELE
jgi:hypothetical protein